MCFGRSAVNGVAAFAAAMSFAATAFSAQVTLVGQESAMAPWRSMDVAKAYDLDGDNIYGEEGYVWYALGGGGGWADTSDPLNYNDGTHVTRKDVPPYLTLANNGQARVYYYNYPLIDDPLQDPAPVVSDVISGLASTTYTVPGQWGTVMNITFGAGAPALLRIGVAFPSLAGANTDTPTDIRLQQTAGGSASATAAVVASATLQIEGMFFDVAGAAAGDTFTLSLKRAPGSVNTIVVYSGVTFDVIPEPGPASMLLLGVIATAAMRRR